MAYKLTVNGQTTTVDAPADSRDRLAGQVVPEHERLHAGGPPGAIPDMASSGG